MSLLHKNMTHKGNEFLINLKKDQLNDSRRKVLSALLEIRINHMANKRSIKTGGKGITSNALTTYINKKYPVKSHNALKRIDEKYESGDITRQERDNLRKNVKIKHSISLRTVQRDLRYFVEEGWVEEINKEYFISEDFLRKTRIPPFHFEEEMLVTIMKLHTPLYNTMKKNLEELITLFGTYMVATMLEASRPIDDLFFTNRGLIPLTFKEKCEFMDNWLEQIVDIKLLYMYFVQTFLNQPNDKIVKNLKKVFFNGLKNNKYIYIDEDGKEYDYLTGVTSNQTLYVDQNGKEYDPEGINDLRRLKRVPSSISPLAFYKSISLSNRKNYYYELDKKTYKKVRKTFEKINPKITNQLKSNIGWSLNPGIKDMVIYDHWNSSVQQP
jgi:hypothetical protein